MKDNKSRYLRAVKRRLNLPKEIKTRVMSDFESDIDARLEAGMPWESVIAELGEPKKAAADLNEQMKEYAYRKSPWRFLFAVGAVLSGCWIVLYAILQRFGMLLSTLQWSYSPNEAASIGVIGGADGPTAIFVTGPSTFRMDWDLILMALLLIGCIALYRRLCRCRQK